ncbi:MAG: hypothetical protein ACOYNO_15530 [Saprospiraceae bacterium]|jgi:hypothetical protein
MKPIIYQLNDKNVIIPPEYVHLVTMKYRKDFYQEFDIEPWAFRRRMAEEGVKLSKRGLLPIKEVLSVYVAMGWPPKMHKDNPKE